MSDTLKPEDFGLSGKPSREEIDLLIAKNRVILDGAMTTLGLVDTYKQSMKLTEKSLGYDKEASVIFAHKMFLTAMEAFLNG